MQKIDKTYLKWFIENSMMEDVGEADHTSNACIPADSQSEAKLLVKDSGVIAGVELAKMIFEFMDKNCEFKTLKKDGDIVNYGDVVFEIRCNSRILLKTERLVLNSMQRLSGIASKSAEFAEKVKGLPVKILDTRKTTPLLRPLEKWAVSIGGCFNYRNGLYDWIMIKDNHVDASGSISKAIKKVKEYLKENELDLSITVEVRDMAELNEVLDTGGITRIMLDNFEIPIMKEAVSIINKRFEVEASGGITLDSVREIAETGVDYISSGALTHSAGILDLSLKIKK